MDRLTEAQLDIDRLKENITNLRKVWDPEPASYVEYSEYGRIEIQVWDILEQQAVILNVSDYNNLEELLIKLLKQSQKIKKELESLQRIVGGFLEEVKDEIWFLSLKDGVTSNIDISSYYFNLKTRERDYITQTQNHK